MKSTKYILLISLLTLILSACGAATQPSVTSLPESMKGYELYSWQDNGEWKFSILLGTNRLKTLDEITSPDTALDLDELKSVLENIPSGQYVTWSTGEGLSFPPDDVINQVEQICEDKSLMLSIVK